METQMTSANNVWADEYKIHSYEVDTKGQATIPFLCQFMQESAWNHAEHLGVGFSHLIEKNSAWVLSRQLIAIDLFPKWGDTITIQTWPTGRERLYWYRDFQILNEDDNPIGRATTAWLVIDLTRRRPQRADAIQLTLPDDIERLFRRRPEKIAPLNSRGLRNTIHVGYRELDVNDHVNNVKYIEWILDTFDLAFHKSHNLQEIEINYLSEATYGDEVSVIDETVNRLTFLHSLERNGDKTELCRARTRWQPL
jgi:medium-chain acyl-[acyl-carrier-protein] hydrolase